MMTKGDWLATQLYASELSQDWFVYNATIQLIIAMGGKVIPLEGGYLVAHGDPSRPPQGSIKEP